MEASQQPEKALTIQQTEKSQHIKIPDPVFYDSIEFLDGQKQVSYTDCFEISVLRFLHLIFGKEGKIIEERLSKFMDLSDQHCQMLVNYFKENPTYEMKDDYYKTEQGFVLRAKWAQFLNKCGLLDLKLQKKYEVKATVLNLLKFYKGFFPKLSFTLQQVPKMDYQNVISGELFKQYEKILTQIYCQLSFDYKITCPCEYSTSDNDMSMMYYWFTQKISIESQHRLDWAINEFYYLNGDDIGQRLGGHSDYRYHS